jgi:signal transduction histidine kinase/ligand-binding sensor domain-containing protein/DNA-binding response OmpR family regulator
MSLLIVLVWGMTEFNSALCQKQSPGYELNFSKLEGLYGKPLGKIRNITQDPYGFMWFAGEEEKCIYRYDGSKLTLYRKDNLNNNSLGGVNVAVVYADNAGIIWVGFTGAGLDAFNPSTNTFTHYRHDDSNKKSLAENNVNTILKDSQGRLWIGTGGGLDQLNVATGEFIHYQHDPSNMHSLSHDFVINIYEDRQGVIWVATAGYPWIVPDLEQGGLNRLEPNGTFTRYKHDPKDEHSLISNKVLALFEDSRGTFWVGTAKDGLHTMDRKTGRFERHTYDPSQPLKLSRPPGKLLPMFGDVDIITFITEDRSGAIWIGTMTAGLTRYDPISGTITRYNNSNGYPDDSTWNGFISGDGVLWIATQQDVLLRVNPIRKVIESKDLKGRISRFLQNEDGTFWVAAAENGLLQLSDNGNILKRITFGQKNGDHINVIDVHRENEESLWLGTTHGVFIFDTKTGEYHPLDLGFDGGATIKILQDQTNPDWKWITTIDSGLVKYSRKGRVLKRYTHDKTNPASISSDHVIIVADDRESLWIATHEGVSRLNKETDSITNYLNIKCTFLYADSRGVLWAGSENGLFQYDVTNDKFLPTVYHSVISTERTYGIIEDHSSNLWISTPSFIVRIDSSREEVSQFGKQNGVIQGSINAGSILKTREGVILVGNGEGYYVVDPDEMKDNFQSPDVAFTEFLIHGSDNSSKQTNLLKAPANEMAPVTLSHNQNTFSIGLLLPDYREPEGNQFQARLLGYDDTWRDITSQHSSNYFAVPPGSYTYELRAYTSRGSMKEKSITVVILPPWWKTWWAYGSYALIAALLLFAARKMIVHDERLKANLQLEHLNFEKAKEVDRVKTSFFTNISHEFRTPLTLIKGPVQELLEKYGNDSGARAKLKLIQRNSDLLLKLINQLLDLARVEAGTLKLEKSEDDVYSFLRAIASSFESFGRQKGVSLSVEIPVVHKSIVYDRDKVETIVINLINNAIKFTPVGGSVHMKAIVDDSTLRFSVRDTGIGISKEHQAKIFERFHQLSEAHKEVGTGIGLSLVKELVAFMGGTIEVISDTGKGSEFIVSIPIESVVEGLSKPIEMTQQSIYVNSHEHDISVVASNGKNGKPQAAEGSPHILVVEDNLDVRRFIIDCMGTEFAFIEAENGFVGLEKARAEMPDLIISDVMMPEMDGMQMTQEIKADIRTSHIPLIMLTAKSTEDSKLHGLQTGADDYLVKPFNKNELLLKVRNAISRQQRLREKLRAELMSSSPPVEVKSQDERFLKTVKDKILERMNDEQLSVETLSEDVGLSRSQLLRKVTALTGMSVNELIRKLRLHRAAQLITQDWGPVSQIAYEVGFSNLSYFSKMFKEEFGIPPSEYTSKTINS